MPRAITGLTFKALPESEQTALLGGIAALNSVMGYKGKRFAVTAAQIEAAAFKNCSDLHASAESDYLRDWIKANARAKGWTDAQIDGAGAADVQKSYDLNFVKAVVEMGELLAQLIKHKRLLARGGSFPQLAATFMSHVQFEPGRVVLNQKGFGEIDTRVKFKTALGLVAWTIIRLSHLRFYGHVVLRCAECREFKIASVRKPLRFCSPEHRNLFNVHRFRARAVKAARKHK